MNEDIFIGIDLGTGSVKAVALDSKGRCIANSKRILNTHYAPGGKAEQSPVAWLDRSGECLRELADRIQAIGYRPAGVGVTGQMNAPVLLNSAGCAPRSVQIWCDSRCAPQCERINQDIPLANLIEITGHTAVAGYTAPKLLWIEENARDVLDGASDLIFPKDLINYALTGIIATDYSDASNSLLLDIRQADWSQSIVDALGIPSRILPSLVCSTDRLGVISSEGEQWSGLPRETPVAGGAGDSIASAFGAGLADSTTSQIVIGTAGNVNCVSDRICVDPLGRVHTGYFVDRSHWICSCVQQTAGASLQWWSEITSLSANDLLGEIDDAPVSESLRFAPYLSGERTPHLDPHVRGAFLGLERSTTRKDLTLAILEGVAFSFRDAFEVLENLGNCARNVLLCGGGAESLLWSRIVQAVIDKPMQRLTCETTARGAAALAACAAGHFSDWRESIESWPVAGETVLTNDEWRRHYRKVYPVHRSVYPMLKDFGKFSYRKE